MSETWIAAEVLTDRETIDNDDGEKVFTLIPKDGRNLAVTVYPKLAAKLGYTGSGDIVLSAMVSPDPSNRAIYKIVAEYAEMPLFSSCTLAMLKSTNINTNTYTCDVGTITTTVNNVDMTVDGDGYVSITAKPSLYAVKAASLGTYADIQTIEIEAKVVTRGTYRVLLVLNAGNTIYYDGTNISIRSVSGGAYVFDEYPASETIVRIAVTKDVVGVKSSTMFIHINGVYVTTLTTYDADWDKFNLFASSSSIINDNVKYIDFLMIVGNSVPLYTTEDYEVIPRKEIKYVS